MAAKALDRVDVHTKLACEAGVTWKATLSHILRCIEEATLEAFFVGSILTVVIPLNWAQRGELVKGRVVRLVYTDGDFDEFRIDDLIEDTGAETLIIRCKSPIHELGEKLRPLTETTSPLVSLAVAKTGTPTALLTAALTAAPTYWSVGTATPTSVISNLWQGVLPLAASLQVPEAVYRTYGTRYELSARRNGTTGYFLDCTAYNSTAVLPDIRTSKNLGPLQRARLAGKHATALVPIGTDGGHVGDNRWEVMAVTVNTHIEVEGIDGGISPLIEDDALNSYYWIDTADGAHEITDSVVVSSTRARFVMASTTGISVGNWGRIARNSSKDQVVQLDYPSKQVIYGVVLRPAQATQPSHTNEILNGDLADWSGSVPDQWSTTGSAPDKIQTAGLWLTGGQSALIDDAGQSLYQTRSIYFPVTGIWTYTVWVKIIVFANAGTGTSISMVRFRDPQTGAEDFFYLNGTTPGLDQLGVWLPFSHSYQITSVGTKTIQVLVGTDAYPAQFYFDSAQFAFTPGPAPFVRHSGAAQNWQQGIALLSAIGEPPAAYDASLLDLSRYDLGRYPYDQLVLGGSLKAFDENLNQSFTERAVQLLIDHRERLDTKVLFANRRDELSALLGGGSVGSVATPSLTPINTPQQPIQPPLPPLPPPGLVTELIEVSSSVTLLEGATYGGTDVTTKTWEPVPFDTIDKWNGSGLTLEADGSIRVTQAGLYGVELAADYYNSILWDPTTPTWAQATLWVESSSPSAQPFLGERQNPFDADATTSGIFQEEYLVTGTRRANAGAFIKGVIRSQRNSAGNHRVSGVTLKVWYIGPLGADNTTQQLRLEGVAAAPAVGTFTVVIT